MGKTYNIVDNYNYVIIHNHLENDNSVVLRNYLRSDYHEDDDFENKFLMDYDHARMFKSIKEAFNTRKELIKKDSRFKDTIIGEYHLTINLQEYSTEEARDWIEYESEKNKKEEN